MKEKEKKRKENDYKDAAEEIKKAIKKMDPYIDVLENDREVQQVLCGTVAKMLKAGQGIAVASAEIIEGIGEMQDTAEKGGETFERVVIKAVEKRQDKSKRQQKAAGRIK